MTNYSKKVREEITNSLVEAIKAGTAPWTRPWLGREAPKNIQGREYSGINTLILTVKGLALDGGIDPRWMTFHQAEEHGLRVKKGAKGTHVTPWKPITESDEQDNSKVVAVVQRETSSTQRATTPRCSTSLLTGRGIQAGQHLRRKTHYRLCPRGAGRRNWKHVHFLRH